MGETMSALVSEKIPASEKHRITAARQGFMMVNRVFSLALFLFPFRPVQKGQNNDEGDEENHVVHAFSFCFREIDGTKMRRVKGDKTDNLGGQNRHFCKKFTSPPFPNHSSTESLDVLPVKNSQFKTTTPTARNPMKNRSSTSSFFWWVKP